MPMDSSTLEPSCHPLELRIEEFIESHHLGRIPGRCEDEGRALNISSLIAIPLEGPLFRSLECPWFVLPLEATWEVLTLLGVTQRQLLVSVSFGTCSRPS